MDVGAALLKAAKANDFRGVQWCIAHGANVNVADAHQLTPLIHAAAGGHYAIVQFLLSSGADSEKANGNGDTARLFARRHGHQAIERLLQVEFDKRIEKVDSGMGVDMSKLLKLLEMVESTLLLTVVETGTIEEVRENATPESVNCVNKKDGGTPLHGAAKRGRSEVIEILVERGARVDAVNTSRQSPLHCAAMSGDGACVRYLVTRASANTRLVDKSGRSALHYACETGDMTSVRILLASGADIGLVDESRLAAVDIAVAGGHLDVVHELNRQGASLMNVSEDGQTILHRAVKSSNADLVEFLANQNMDVDVTDACGWSPLHCASHRGNLQVCEKLLECGAAVNRLTASRPTNPSEEDAQSTLELAVEGDHNEILSLLLAQHGIDVNIRNGGGRTPLISAAAKGRYTTVQQLVDVGADVNIRGNMGETALIMATIGGFAKAVHVLLEQGARTDIASNSGKTPLTVAKSTEVRELLQLYHNSQQYHDKCFALIHDPTASPTIEELTKLVPLITSVYDLRLMLTLVAMHRRASDSANEELHEPRRRLIKDSFTLVVTKKFTYDDDACVFFKMSLEHCERETLLARSDVLLLDRQAEKVNTESADWVLEMKKQVYVNSWRLDAHDQHLHAVVTGVKEVHAMVMENRKVLVKVSQRVGGLQKQVGAGKKLLGQLRTRVDFLAKDMTRFESRLSQSEENIQQVATSLQSFKEVYVDRLRQQERNEKIKRVCGIVASVAGFVFAPLLKEAAGAVVDFINPLDIVEKVYGEQDIARFVAEGSAKVLPKVIQDQLEKYAIPQDEFETLLREEIVLQHPEYVVECAKRGLSVHVDGGQSDVARSVEPMLDTEEAALLKLVGELQTALGNAVESNASAKKSSSAPLRLNVTVPRPSFVGAPAVGLSSPPRSPSAHSLHGPSARHGAQDAIRQSARVLGIDTESSEPSSISPLSPDVPTFGADESVVVFQDDADAFHYHMAVHECGGELDQFMELVEMIDGTTCDPSATMTMELRTGGTSRESLCAAAYAYCRGFEAVGDLLASQMEHPPAFDRTAATAVELLEDIEDFPFIYAVDESLGDVEECTHFLELLDESADALTATIQAAVVRGTSQSVQWTAVDSACHLGYVEIVKFMLKETHKDTMAMKTKFQMLKAVRERSVRMGTSRHSAVSSAKHCTVAS